MRKIQMAETKKFCHFSNHPKRPVNMGVPEISGYLSIFLYICIYIEVFLGGCVYFSERATFNNLASLFFFTLALVVWKKDRYLATFARYTSVHAVSRMARQVADFFSLRHLYFTHTLTFNNLMHKSYIALTPNALHQRLLKERIHPTDMQRIKDEVAALKESQRVDKITRTQRKAEWDKLLKPLRYELNNAKVGRAYDLDDEDRVLAFDAYILVMETLLTRFAKPMKSLEATPIQLALEKALPNNGEHWTDWVPEKIKERIALMFEQLPPKLRAKRKVPFQRLSTPEQNAKAKERLLRRTEKEIETLERKQSVTQTESGQTTLLKMKEAMKIIVRLSTNEHIPATWAGVL
jgi:hypothetical protein